MFERYAIYYTPQGALADAGAQWLGWDVALGAAPPALRIDGFDREKVTETPRKYGMHGTIKPPFHLADGMSFNQLQREFRNLCDTCAPVNLDRLEVLKLGGFFALVPVGDQAKLAQLAALVVKNLDHFRAEPSEAELARRRQKSTLTPAQDRNLRNWGYPYVLDEFRFHITLTGRLGDNAASVQKAIVSQFTDHLQAPLQIDSLTLVGQKADGMFHEINRFALTG